jgi:ABC-type polysaccharide/polyol phosphate export permease
MASPFNITGKYWHLIRDMAVRDLKVRYKTAGLGFFWIILIPLFQIFIFKIVFSVIIKVPVADYHFFIFLMTAMFPWRYFNLCVTQATEGIVGNASLIKKTQFPRQIIPISIVMSNLAHFVLILALMIIFLGVFGIKLTPLIFYLPLLLLLQTMLCMGMALITSSLQVCFRDVKYIVEIALMAWFYLTPIFYPLSLVAGISRNFLKVYLLNPLAGLVTLYRVVLLGGYVDNLPPEVNLTNLIALCSAGCIGIFFLGFGLFKKCEPKFFDLL